MTDALLHALPVADGYRAPLHVRPAAEPMASLLFMPALGIKAGYYLKLAEALAARGFHVGVLEQRGHGDSSLRAGRGTDYGFREWLEQDIPAALAWLRDHAPDLPVVVGGHSLGGHLATCYAGLHPETVDGLVLTAAASPYWRAFSGKTKAQVMLLIGLLPPLTAALGYYPGNRIGFGSREARTLMRDWRRMATDNVYAASGLAADLERGLARLTLPVLQLLMADDPYAPQRGADAVTDKLTSAVVSKRVLDAAELGAPADHLKWARHPAAPADAIADWWRQTGSRP